MAKHRTLEVMKMEGAIHMLEVQPFWSPTQETPEDLEILRDNLKDARIRALFSAKGVELPNLQQFNTLIESSLKNEANYIGNGGAGRVYTLDLPQESQNLDRVCLKIVHYDPEFAKVSNQKLGNTPHVEFTIQTVLTSMNGKDARKTPIALELLHATNDFYVFVMEKLPAVNLQAVLNKTEKVPENFDYEEFMFTLEEYVQDMHDLGIVHNDLEPRNVMVDTETGKPYIIDFGRSLHVSEDLSEIEKRKLFDLDFKNVEKTGKLVKAMFDNKE